MGGKKKPTAVQLERKNAALRQKHKQRPINYAEAVVLKMLPKEGTRVGLKEIALPVKQLVASLKEDGATHEFINGLIRSLLHREHVIGVELIPRNQGIGYQITKRGEEALSDYEENYGKR